MRAHSPHRRDYALEAGMQHRRRDMNDLIWLLRIALGRLARRQIREPRLVEVHIHELGNGELPIAEVEAAVECARLVLGAMACQVNKVRSLDARRDTFDCRVVRDGVDTAVTLACLCRVLDRRELPLHEQ
jgi:hypothetical protein